MYTYVRLLLTCTADSWHSFCVKTKITNTPGDDINCRPNNVHINSLSRECRRAWQASHVFEYAQNMMRSLKERQDVLSIEKHWTKTGNGESPASNQRQGDG